MRYRGVVRGLGGVWRCSATVNFFVCRAVLLYLGEKKRERRAVYSRPLSLQRFPVREPTM